MSVAVEEKPQVEEVVFDPKAYIESRNAGKEPPKPEAKAEPAKAEPEHVEQRPSRSAARLQRAIGREQALREAAEAEVARLRAGQNTPAAPVEEKEPKRADFASDGEYLRAAQKWDKAQEAKTAGASEAHTKQTEALREHFKAMDAKAADDIKAIPDWDEVQKAAAEDDDAPEFDPAKHPTLMGMIASSDMQAFVLYHFAKNPEALEKMLEMTKDPNAQIRSFHRLEGKLEKEYDSTQKAAQASESGKPKPEDRKHLAEAVRPGEPQQVVPPAKPKPSSEVAARGGSPAPEEPPIGSSAWMAKRNQEKYGR